MSSGEGHPGDELLAAYASGSLPTAPGLVIACHLHLCAECCGMVERLEEVGGALLRDAPSAELSPDAVDKALARIEEAPRATTPPGPTPDSDLPPPLARAGLGRRRRFGTGWWIAHAPVGRDSDWRVFLLHAPAGAAIPTHGHAGPEYLCVLEGAFRDGGTHRRGDFVESSAEHEHSLRVTDDAPCLCLIATQGPLKWRGPMRLLSPVFGL